MTFSIEQIIWVAIYLRVSTSRQAQEGYSLDGQLEGCIKLAQQKYGPNVRWKVYMDEGISGKDLEHRPSLLRMMRDVKEGHFTAVITWKVSRLSRNLVNALNVVTEIVHSNAQFVSVKEGDYDSPNDRLTFNLLASIAEYQREDLAENVKLGMGQRASEGKWNGGQVLGYRSSNEDLLTVVPDEAATVQLIFRKVDEEHWGGKKLASFLNKCGYKTKKGNPFTISAVHGILRNPLYKGYIRFSKSVDPGGSGNYLRKANDLHLVRGTHESIVPEDVWDRVQSILNERSTGVPRQYSGTFPLTGIARCPECGAFMTSMYGSKRKDGTKARYYVCGRYHNGGSSLCRTNGVRADRLEEDVWNRLSVTLSDDLIVESLVTKVNDKIDQHNGQGTPGEEKQLLKKLQGLKAKKTKIQEGYEAGLYTALEANEKLKPLREAIDELEHELEPVKKLTPANTQLSHVTADVLRHQLRDFLTLRETLDVHEFRELLQTCIEKIEVQNKALKTIHYSFVVSNGDSTESDSESDPEDPLHIQNQNSILLRALPSHAQKRHLSMVRFTAGDSNAAI